MTSESDPESLEILASYPTHMARALADRLTESGVRVALRPEPLGRGTRPPRGTDPGGNAPRAASRGGYGASARLHVLVTPGDLEHARQVESRFVREQVPDLPEGFDPESQPTDQCPACQAPLPASDVETCPECGLGFPG